MTDKQIIIDGVNVAECEHLYREIDCLAHIDFSNCCEGYDKEYGYCPNIPNCYYKQLKRKEQECEEWKTKLAKSFADERKKEIIIDLLKTEKETYKQTLIDIKPILEFYANSKIGKEQPDRTYKIMLSGGYITVYDPKPAREALRKINEVEK